MFRLLLRLTVITTLTLVIAAFSAHWIGVETGHPMLMWDYQHNNSIAAVLWDGQNIFHFPNEAKELMLYVRWSLDGHMAWVDYHDEQVRVNVWDGWRVITVSEPNAYSYGLSWSQDGRLAWQGGALGEASIYVWDGEQTTVVSDSSSHALNPHWSLDGRLAWVGYTETESSRDIIVWDGRHEVNITQSAANEHDPHWSPDGQLVWIARDDAGTRIMRWDGTNAVVVAETPFSIDSSWSSDGRLALSADTGPGNTEIVVWDGEETTEVSTSPLFDIEPEWSPDGRLAWFTVISLDQMVEQQNSEITVWDGTNERTIYQTNEGVLYNLAWSP